MIISGYEFHFKLLLLCLHLLAGLVNADGHNVDIPVSEPNEEKPNFFFRKRNEEYSEPAYGNRVKKDIAVHKCEDDTWVQSGSLCYKIALFSDVPTSFEQGKEICKVRFGAFVAPFKYEGDRKTIKASVDKLGYNLPKKGWLGLYIGLRDVSLNTTADYRWDHDSSALDKFTSWGKEQPSRGYNGAEQCVTVMIYDNYNWNDVICSGDKNFIGIVCAKLATVKKGRPSVIVDTKKAVHKAETKSKHGKCADETWSLSNVDKEIKQQMCFKVIEYKNETFDSAAKLCEKVGGKPAPIRSENDRLAVLENIKKINITANPSRYTSLFIGLQDRSDSKWVPAQYQWAHSGEKLGKYTYWNGGNPNRLPSPGGSFEKCVSILLRNNLRWMDIDCSQFPHTQGIVCAQEPK